MKMYSYSTLLKESVDACKILLYVINALGISPYTPQIPGRYKRLPVIYAVIVMLWFVIYFPISFYFTNKFFTFSLPMFAIYMQKFCENLLPVLLILRALYDNSNTFNSRIKDLVYADQCLFTVGVKVWFGVMKRYLQVSSVIVTTYCVCVTGFYTYTIALTMLGVWDSFSAVILALANCLGVVYSIYFSYYFCSAVTIFKYRFQALNEEIRLIQKKRITSSIRFITVSPQQLKDIARVKTIKFAHAIYRDYLKKHNTRYGPILLLQVFQSTVLTILYIYFTVSLLYYSSVQVIPQTILTRSVMFFSYMVGIVQNFVVLLGSIIFCCHRTSVEV